jgi:hypothetical protein
MSEDLEIKKLFDLFTIKGFMWGFLSGVGFAVLMISMIYLARGYL